MNKELEKKIDREYWKAMEICHQLYPDIFTLNPTSAGFTMCSLEEFIEKRLVEIKLSEFKQDPEFIRPFDKKYYDQVRI